MKTDPVNNQIQKLFAYSPLRTYPGVVKAVKGNTCLVQLAQSGLTVPVKLFEGEADPRKVELIPATGSTVIVGMINRKASELELIGTTDLAAIQKPIGDYQLILTNEKVFVENASGQKIQLTPQNLATLFKP